MPISETAHQLFDAFDRHDLTVIGAYLRGDFKLTGNADPLNKQGLLNLLAAYFKAFSDFDFNFTEAQEHDHVLRARYAVHGTHDGTLDLNPAGIPVIIPATGKKLALPQSSAEFTFDEDGLVAGLVLHQVPGAALADLVTALGATLPNQP
ncbi:MAG: nuclear transport factor 2 family protein [Anaerolineae bacterium]|nr:nuclear transport factor 2 family protein [Anaerolineae bacterium]